MRCAGYFPKERLVRGRVNGRANRAGSVYGFPMDHVAADGRAIFVKLQERAEAAGGAFVCYLCGDRIQGDSGWHLDHVVPLVLRGAHTDDNLEAACPSWNL